MYYSYMHSEERLNSLSPSPHPSSKLWPRTHLMTGNPHRVGARKRVTQRLEERQRDTDMEKEQEKERYSRDRGREKQRQI